MEMWRLVYPPLHPGWLCGRGVPYLFNKQTSWFPKRIPDTGILSNPRRIGNSLSSIGVRCQSPVIAFVWDFRVEFSRNLHENGCCGKLTMPNRTEYWLLIPGVNKKGTAPVPPCRFTLGSVRLGKSTGLWSVRGLLCYALSLSLHCFSLSPVRLRLQLPIFRPP